MRASHFHSNDRKMLFGHHHVICDCGGYENQLPYAGIIRVR